MTGRSYRLTPLAVDHGLTKWDVATSLLRHRLQHREAEIRQLIQQKEADDRQQMAEAEALEARQTKELEERSQWIEKRAHEIATSRDRSRDRAQMGRSRTEFPR
jgi:hypothetical protein